MGVHGKERPSALEGLELAEGWGVFRHGESCGVAREEGESQPLPGGRETGHRLEREVGARQAGVGWGSRVSAQQGTQGRWACLRSSSLKEAPVR